jgi:NAD(P)-dependent dehydrogenase (short-subunit alcohol dehydrogenase family)
MKNGGVLINAASFASLMPSVNAGVYAATKAAISSLTRTLSSELAPYNIRVVGYIPGLIATDINNESIARNRDRLLEAISLRKFGTAEDVAYGIVFLASEYASYISGTCLEITGGKFATQNPMAAWDI